MPDLTKWPLLLVDGQSVTETQANEILVRTNSPYLSVNDRSWTATVGRIMGFDVDAHFFPVWESVKAMQQRLRMLELSYMENSRIASSWLGGPHGWCDWDGRIGSSNYNIGKWPSEAAVTADWKLIAAAFPYLDLTAQLVTEEGAGELAAEWRIVGGTVEQREPGERLQQGGGLADSDMFRCLLPGGERGVSADRLTAAVAQVLAAKAAS